MALSRFTSAPQLTPSDFFSSGTFRAVDVMRDKKGKKKMKRGLDTIGGSGSMGGGSGRDVDTAKGRTRKGRTRQIGDTFDNTFRDNRDTNPTGTGGAPGGSPNGGIVVPTLTSALGNPAVSDPSLSPGKFSADSIGGFAGIAILAIALFVAHRFL